jgi:cysteine desulfurase/selenocysteine lyase
MQNIYLNTASSGLVPAEFTTAASKLMSELATNASTRAEQWRDDEQPAIRQHVAEFLGVGIDNVALVPNFSWAMNGIVHSLRGDEKVLLYTADYPSLTEPFKINGFDITWMNDTDGFTIAMEELQNKLLSEKVEVLAISHVQWLSGFKIDLQTLGSFCREHDIWLIVDATQSMGAIAINPIQLGVDVLISSNYKWMNAGFGTGVMYMSDEFFEAYTPKVGGNNSYGMIDGAMKYTPSVRSFEPGHPNMYGFTILQQAIEHKLATGVGAIETHNRKLTQMLLDGIRGLNVSLIGEPSTDNRASMVFLRDEDGSLLQFIKSNGILVSGRMGHVRISMHYYNTEAEITALVDVLKKV